jgi:hypothetical protein
MRNSHSSIRVESLFDTDRYMYKKYPPPPSSLLMYRIICAGLGGRGPKDVAWGRGGGVVKSI